MKKVIVLSPVKLGSVIHKPGGKPLVLEDGIADQLIDAHLVQLSAVVEQPEKTNELNQHVHKGSGAADTGAPGLEPAINTKPKPPEHKPGPIDKVPSPPKSAAAKKAASKSAARSRKA